MFCPHCGKENEDGAVFCGECGKSMKVNAAKPVRNTAPVKRIAPVKRTMPAITKEKKIEYVLIFISILLFLGVFFVLFMSLKNESAVAVKSVFDAEVVGKTSLNEALNVLISGNKIFNPTAVSAAIGIVSYILIYSLPLFAIFALYGIISGIKRVAFTTVFYIMAFFTTAISVAVVPVALVLVTGFKEALAVSTSILAEDVKSVSYITLIIFAGIALVLIVACMVIASVINKRRVK